MTGNKRGIPNQPTKHSFAIVKFHLPGNSYQFDIAPLDWLRKSGNRNTCYWPSEDEVRSSTQLVTLIKKNAVVDKETWSVFTVTVIAKFDTYKGAQDKLKDVIAGEPVVSTDLEKRGKGGRSAAKKRKTAAALTPVPIASTCASFILSDGGPSSSPPSPSSPSPAPEDAPTNYGLNGHSSDVSFTGLPVLLTSDDEHGRSSTQRESTQNIRSRRAGNKHQDISVATLVSIPSAPAFEPQQRTLTPQVAFAKKSAPTVAARDPTTSVMSPCDAKKLDDILQTNIRILRGLEQVKATQTDIQNTLSVIMNNTIPSDPELLGIKDDLCLPVKSLTAFDRINLIIREDKTKRLKLKSYLTGVGGTEHRIVGKVLQKLMRYSVASQFCFKGQNGEKRCFCTTAVSAVAIESLRATPGVRLTEEQIAVKIGRWLKAAPQKIGSDDKSDDDGDSSTGN
ncbi:uncharacterized protein LOC116932897 [Daphnia magna]|uniref:uncharacterized protein LOC116932897 n=1 Tax=Daphnia magna TaxID=35525 RepID=UPI001E1BDEA1|nr:uncharacterized protein LOC116932897 [Daphnia magna]